MLTTYFFALIYTDSVLSPGLSQEDYPIEMYAS